MYVCIYIKKYVCGIFLRVPPDNTDYKLVQTGNAYPSLVARELISN
jgi:hypothetical protein